ncbi:MAG: 4Fe-4S dicluster domain-containing protein [Desulfofustis sp.]
MPAIDKETCTGCRICQTYCTVDAILFNDSKWYIDPDLCTECYVCLRMRVCPEDAIYAEELVGFYKQFQHVISDPVENHGVTGVTGRGTEEVKTNDVSGRVKKGWIGLSIDMGRPGLGVYLRDAEKVAMAIADAGFKLAPQEESPLAALMPDASTGKLEEGCLGYRLLSVIIEGRCEEEKAKDVFKALLAIEKEIDTVFSVGLISRVDENGDCRALGFLDELGIDRPHRGKVNPGLGKPLSTD